VKKEVNWHIHRNESQKQGLIRYSCTKNLSQAEKRRKLVGKTPQKRERKNKNVDNFHHLKD